MSIKTHSAIDNTLCGRVLERGDGRCKLEIELTPIMRADATGLVHGGFIFGAADYAAMVAVNEPFVVLAAAEVKFLRPSRVGDRLLVLAQVAPESNPRRPTVTASVVDGGGQEVFVATFSCAVPRQHVLDAAQGARGHAPALHELRGRGAAAPRPVAFRARPATSP